jgi:hypothetical protein
MKVKISKICKMWKSIFKTLFKKYGKLFYKMICLSIMCYQIINITLNYLSFPFNVNLYLTDDQNKHLPSITICMPFNGQCLFDSPDQFNLHIKPEGYSKVIPLDCINCNLYFAKYNKFINCKQISQINEIFIVNEYFKCITYFQKRESYYNLSIVNEEISYIEIEFNKTLLFRRDRSCYDKNRL